mgnify:CR=1 FL=1
MKITKQFIVILILLLGLPFPLYYSILRSDTIELRLFYVLLFIIEIAFVFIVAFITSLKDYINEKKVLTKAFQRNSIILLIIVFAFELYLFFPKQRKNKGSIVNSSYQIICIDTFIKKDNLIEPLDKFSNEQLLRNEKGEISVLMKKITFVNENDTFGNIFQSEIFYTSSFQGDDTMYFSILSDLNCRIQEPTINQECEKSQLDYLNSEKSKYDNAIKDVFNEVDPLQH